ncbi:30S ribosomal protein S3 [Candidatus Bathyarchaeota archaeon]|nr:30S ribosomal protein S3 [Candidatus Bathyarchaeota archaeon]
MSVVKRIIQDSIERVKVDELLLDEYEQAGYGGIQLTKTPLGAQINLFAMRPGRVIGKRGRAIKKASERLEFELGLPNPQITVVEIEVPEMNPQIMASRVANALERGVHFRRAIFWSLRRIMDSGALGCEVILKGPLRSARSRFEKVVEGYVPKSGDPALTYVRSATMHVKMKRGVLGVTVRIVPPDAKFPDKVNLDNLPEIEYQLPIPEPVAEPEMVEEAPEELVTEESVTESAVEAAEPAEPVAEPEPLLEEEAPVIEEEIIEEPEALVKLEEPASEAEKTKPVPAEEPVKAEAKPAEEKPSEPSEEPIEAEAKPTEEKPSESSEEHEEKEE